MSNHALNLNLGLNLQDDNLQIVANPKPEDTLYDNALNIDIRDQCSENFKATLERVEIKASQSANAIATPEHLLLCLLYDPDAVAVLRGCNFTDAQLSSISLSCEDPTAGTQKHPRENIKYSEDLARVLSLAKSALEQSNQKQIDGAIVLALLIGDARTQVAQSLLKFGLTFEIVMNRLRVRKVDDDQPKIIANRMESSKTLSANRMGSSKTLSPAELDQEINKRVFETIGRVNRFKQKDNKKLFSNLPPSGTANAERLGNPASPEMATDYSPAPDKIDAGCLVENIPRRMRIAIPVTIEARISREESEKLYEDFVGESKVHKHKVYVSRAMTVQLHDPGDNFTVRPLSPETQWVDNKLGLIDGHDFGTWQWTVTPIKRGMRKLQLVVSALTTDKDGITAESPLRPQIIEVDVRINYSLLFKRASTWIVVVLCGSVLGKYSDNFVTWLSKYL